MNKKELYKNYISKIEEALNKDSFDTLDFILTYYSSPNFTEQEREAIEEIVGETTLYLELRETEYKEKALELIVKFKK